MPATKVKKKIISHIYLWSDPVTDGRLFFREDLPRFWQEAQPDVTGILLGVRIALSITVTVPKVLRKVMQPPAIRKEISAFEFYEISRRVLAVFN